MVRLIIADDEEEIRLSLRDIIPWRKYGIEVVGTAKNGQEAYEITEKGKPDIALVDIKMPELDGLSFIERAKQSRSGIQIIILSGYDNFEYTQEAIRLGASAYLLKPADPAEILNTVLKCAEKVKEEKKKLIRVKRFENEIDLRLPILKERFFSRLLNAQDVSDSLREQLSFYHSKLQENMPVRTAVIRIGVLGDFNDNDRRIGFESAKHTVLNILQQRIIPIAASEAFEYANDCLLIYDAERHNVVKTELEKLVVEIKKEGWCIPFIATGESVHTLLQIYSSYRQALKSLDDLIHQSKGEDGVVESTKVSDTNPDDTYPIDVESSVLHAIRTLRSEEAESFLGDFFHHYRTDKAMETHLKEHCLTMYSAILHLCLEKGIDPSERLHDKDCGLQELLEAEDSETFKAILSNLTRLTSECLKEVTYQARIVDRAAKFIRTNFQKPLTLALVAEEVYVTPNYLSMLFKKELGINFLTFLHRCRIETACTLLADNSRKIYEIAEEIGYSDTKYFTQVFKKHTGVSPQQFRIGR